MTRARPIKNVATGKEHASFKDCIEYDHIHPNLLRRILSGEYDYRGTMYDYVYIEKTEREEGRLVKIVETGEVFPSVAQCAEFVGCHPTEIFACLNPDKGRKSARGYTFDYV